MTYALSIEDLPEVIAELRLAMANILREEADAEPSGYVAAKLRTIAAGFEAGIAKVDRA